LAEKFCSTEARTLVVGLDACWIQADGQNRQAGWLLEADDPDGWQLIEVDDPHTVPPTGDGPGPEARQANQTLLWAGSTVQVPRGVA